MHKKAYLILASLYISFSSIAQTTYLPLGSDDYLLLDRLETKSGRLCDSLVLSDKAESRKNAVNYLEHLSMPIVDSFDSAHFSKVDLYNMRQMISENGEWAPDEKGEIASKHPIFRTFYKNQYNFVYVKTKDFFLVINPVLNGTITSEHDNPVIKSAPTSLVYNSHDFEMRAWIAKKLSIYTALTDNQEKMPSYIYNYALKNGRNMSVPGAGYFLYPNTRSGNFDYLQASGYIDFAAIKDHLNVTFGNGKHFIGDGLTSLFLTDFSSNMPFLQLKAKIWKVSYECLYLELTQQYDKTLGDGMYNHKYATMHYITYNAARWLSLGFFESVVFDRSNSYEISYLNPVALTIGTNGFNGEADKSLIGFTAKVIAAHHFQLYGQLMLNEFNSKEFFSNKGWYGNKWGVQAGAKYFDVLGIKNFDLQGEVDMVRPYTYTAKDTLANYTNYNQPLADPLGAGFIKFMGMARLQPFRNITLTLKAMYYTQGLDTGNKNYGNNIFDPYVTAPNGQNTYGVKMINGPKAQGEVINLNLSIQVRRNVFFDLGSIYRKYESTTGIYPGYSSTGIATGPLTTNAVYFGVRINAARRDYTFY